MKACVLRGGPDLKWRQAGAPSGTRQAQEPSAAHRQGFESLSGSPRVIAQRRQFDRLFGPVGERSPAAMPLTASDAARANPVQRKVDFHDGAVKYDPTQNQIASAIYNRQVQALDRIAPLVDVREQGTGPAEGLYTPIADGGQIEIGSMKYPINSPQGQTEFNSNIGSMTHEMQHALDDLTRTVRFRSNKVNVLHAEWRAWAIQAAVTLEHHRSRRPVDIFDFNIMKCFKDKKTLATPGNAFFRKTARYLNSEQVIANPKDEDVTSFMHEHTDWLGDALLLFYSNVPEGIGGFDWDQVR